MAQRCAGVSVTLKPYLIQLQVLPISAHTRPHGAFAGVAPKSIIRAVIVFPSLETIYAPRYLRTVRCDCVSLLRLRDGQGDARPSVRRRSFRAIRQRNEKRTPEPDARCWSRAKLAAYR